MPGSPTRFPASHDLLPVARCLSALCRRSGNSHSGTPKSHSTAADRCRFLYVQKKHRISGAFLFSVCLLRQAFITGNARRRFPVYVQPKGNACGFPFVIRKHRISGAFLYSVCLLRQAFITGNARRRFPVYVQPKGNACGFPFVIRKHRISGAFLFAFSPSGTQSSRHPPSCQ